MGTNLSQLKFTIVLNIGLSLSRQNPPTKRNFNTEHPQGFRSRLEFYFLNGLINDYYLVC
ncbi:MAG TPA: hypothetical protein DEQ50_02665 [Lactobacillus sp.]|nr:hypothetical protein [Lactobacillus sp.]